jgi:hypothetical protein
LRFLRFSFAVVNDAEKITDAPPLERPRQRAAEANDLDGKGERPRAQWFECLLSHATVVAGHVPREIPKDFASSDREIAECEIPQRRKDRSFCNLPEFAPTHRLTGSPVHRLRELTGSVSSPAHPLTRSPAMIL